MIQIETLEVYSRHLCQQNMNKLYVFGENENQYGSSVQGGGQAVIRPEPNAIGLCTLAAIGSYWTDANILHNKYVILRNVEAILQYSSQFEIIAFPKYGLGTGRANMITECPKTFLFLCTTLLEVFGYNNIAELTIKQF